MEETERFLVNKSQDGWQRGVREARRPSCGFDGSIPVLLGGNGDETIPQPGRRSERKGLKRLPWRWTQTCSTSLSRA